MCVIGKITDIPYKFWKKKNNFIFLKNIYVGYDAAFEYEHADGARVALPWDATLRRD